MRQSSPKLQLKTVLSRLLPKKLIELWLEQGLIQDEVIANLSKVRLENLENLIHNWQFIPNGTEGYRTLKSRWVVSILMKSHLKPWKRQRLKASILLVKCSMLLAG